MQNIRTHLIRYLHTIAQQQLNCDKSDDVWKHIQWDVHADNPKQAPLVIVWQEISLK